MMKKEYHCTMNQIERTDSDSNNSNKRWKNLRQLIYQLNKLMMMMKMNTIIQIPFLEHLKPHDLPKECPK
jgi:hypothetical protein